MARSRDQDACPGALSVHQAADGALARIRLPGGLLSAPQLEALAHASSEFGSGTLELTVRGNLQIRGIRDDAATAAVAEAVAAAGLLPSPTHERVRNIVASPLSGRVGDFPDVRRYLSELDTAIQSSAALAGLPGRFWFSVDDGRGDVSGLGSDVGAHFVDGAAALLLGGHDTGIRLAPDALVPTLVAAAEHFVEIRGTAWRVDELSDPMVLMDGARHGPRFPPETLPPVGWIEQSDGRVALGGGVRLGVLEARLAEYVAAIGKPLAITPWRSLVVFDMDDGVADVALRVLAPMGLVFDEKSPWLQISACTGSPGCERSATDVRADAATAAELGSTGTHRHWVGCERACGSPAVGEVLVATGDGYRRQEMPH